MKNLLTKSTEGAPLYEQKGACAAAQSVEARFMTRLRPLGIPYAGAVSAFAAVTALVPIFGAWIGGEAFGILGTLFSVPVCAVLFSLYLEYMKNAHTF